MCSSTRRADQRRPGSNHGAWAARGGVEVERQDELVGVPRDLARTRASCAGERLALEQSVRVRVGRDLGRRVRPVDRLPVDLGGRRAALDHEGRPLGSVSATCLTRPPRVSSLTVVRVRACSSEQLLHGDTWSLLTNLEGQPGSEEWDDPANQPPGHLGISGFQSDPDDADRFWAIVQGVGPLRDDRRRHVVDAAQPRAPRRLAAPARRGRLLRAQGRALAAPTAIACTSRTTSACTAATTAGTVVDRDHRRPADRVRLRGRRRTRTTATPST